MTLVLVFLISFLTTLVLIPFLIRLARRLDFLDYPSVLKVHTKPTPLFGGLATFFGFCIAQLIGLHLFSLPFNPDMVGIFVGGALVVAFGLVDDKRGLSPSYKFVGQIIAAVLFLILSHNTKILTGSNWDMLILIIWVVGLMNAVNFLDAMDGLCAGISFIAASAFLVIALFNHQPYSVLLALSLMGALLGFLRYNWTPAKIFSGDAGSMFNGFILACLGILFVRGNASYSSLLVPILILSYPIFDISFVTLVRLREGRKVYVGDYNNSPRRIASLGMQSQKVVLWIYLFCFLLGSLGVLVYFFFDSPIKMLIAVFVWLILVIFGVHLQRNFVNIKEKLILVFCDILMINAVFLFFYWLKFHSGLFPTLLVIPLSEYVAPAIWITIFWVNLFAIFGLYEVLGDSRFQDEMKAIAKAVAMGVVIFLILTLDPAYLQLKSWIPLVVYSLALIFASGLVRSLFTYLVRRFNLLGVSVRKSLIVGTKQKAEALLQKLSSHPEYGYQVIGLIKEDDGNSPADLSESFAGRILGDVENLDEITRERKVQDILIAVDPDWKGSLHQILNSVHNLEVSFKVVSDSGDLMRGYQTVPLRSGLLLRIFPSHMRSWEWLIKRLWDGLISLVVLIGFFPLWLLIGLLIKISYKSNSLVKGKYLGKMGKELELFTFRVSQHNPEVVKNQLEQTPSNMLGRFLRKTGLEKVPVFINILKGEMSLVGPEPLAKETFKDLSTRLPLLPKRLSVKPGLVSLAKIKGGFRQYAEAAGDHLRDDIFYMENMSLLLDLKILLGGLTSFLRR
jgi:UDP-N-acetylmuramyl pentapeptide phosphotransferase/UDP-N-acetylglucosamine-1-phosphate transferase/lipopolysaccharide/colanic/teichoic acid biosynthesis glycosyltransferase